MKFSITIKTFFALILSCNPLLTLDSHAAETSHTSRWNFPLKLTDDNTKIKFEVDTTWHIVYGNVSGVSGSIVLKNEHDPSSIAAEIHLPVKKFSTGWSARDESLQDHMNADSYPEVLIKISHTSKSCQPSDITSDDNANGCKTTLVGTLTICNVTKDVEIDATVKKVDDQFEVSGTHSLLWAEYNVEDPSMIVAKVNPEVSIAFTVKLQELK